MKVGKRFQMFRQVKEVLKKLIVDMWNGCLDTDFLGSWEVSISTKIGMSKVSDKPEVSLYVIKLLSSQNYAL